MKSKFILLTCLLVLGAMNAGCEEPAANETLEITLEGVGPRDVSGSTLQVEVALTGECTSGPCDPNPCTEGPQTRCIGQGTVFRCECPAGTSLDTVEEEEVCTPDEGCTPTFCGQNGVCEEDEMGMPGCMCEMGYTGANCQSCDNDAGYFADGFGGCTNEFDVCRVGQGGDVFAAFLDEAESSLGHPPNELELVKVEIRPVAESATGVRNWPYLWSEDVELLLTPGEDNPVEAAVADTPGEDQGLESFEMDVLIDRPTFTRNPEFFEGDFTVGLSGKTERLGNEPFELDLQIIMEFNAY